MHLWEYYLAIEIACPAVASVLSLSSASTSLTNSPIE